MMKEEEYQEYLVCPIHVTRWGVIAFFFFFLNQGKEQRRRSVFGMKMLNSVWTSVEYLNVQ